DDESAYLVYADFLQSRGDPRGELVVCQSKGKRGDRRAHRLLDEHERYFLGDLARHEASVKLEWRLGFIRAATVMVLREQEEAGVSQAALVKTLLALPSARFLQELTLGCASVHEDAVAAAVIGALVEAGPRPGLHRLAFAVNTEEEMLSWTETGPLGPVWSLYPGLTSVDIVAGSLELGELVAPALETLRIETCGLTSANVRAIAGAKLQALKRLELWFGDSERREPNAKVEDIPMLLESGVLANVGELGLVNTTFTDELVVLLSDAAVFGRIESLDLSRGTMTDAGAISLAEARKRAPKLHAIDVRENYLSPAGIQALEKAGFTVRADEQRDEEAYEGATYRYCAVAE
ncbi:MAG: hypothetical protein K0S65_2098, partial [Labilithrix sp.]|nr:hypothetical protein [Labilithrix sp.]